MAKERKQAGQNRHIKPKETFHLDKELQEALQRFCDQSEPNVDKSETIRTALKHFLKARGFWPPPGASE